MGLELLFPGAAMVLKGLLKLLVDHNLDRVRLARAVFAGPVDLVFLAISYGVAAMVILSSKSAPNAKFLEMVGVLFVYVIIGMLITLACSKVEKAFVGDKNWIAVVGCIICYVVSGGLLFWTIGGGFFH